MKKPVVPETVQMRPFGILTGTLYSQCLNTPSSIRTALSEIEECCVVIEDNVMLSEELEIVRDVYKNSCEFTCDFYQNCLEKRKGLKQKVVES